MGRGQTQPRSFPQHDPDAAHPPAPVRHSPATAGLVRSIVAFGFSALVTLVLL